MKTSFKLIGISLAAVTGMAMIGGDGAENQPNTGAVEAVTAANQVPPTDASKTLDSNNIGNSGSAAPSAAAPTTYVQPAKPAPPPGVSISYETEQVAKLARTGIDPNVIKAYAENSQYAVAPSVDEIIYLRSQGVSSDTISALIRRGNQLQAQHAQNAANNAVPQPATPAPVVPPVQYVPQYPTYADTAQEQSPVVVYNQTPSYSYVNPTVYYGSYWPYYGYGFGGCYYNTPLGGYGWYPGHAGFGYPYGYHGGFGGHFNGVGPRNHFGGHFGGGGPFNGGGHFGGGGGHFGGGGGFHGGGGFGGHGGGGHFGGGGGGHRG